MKKLFEKKVLTSNVDNILKNLKIENKTIMKTKTRPKYHLIKSLE